MSFPLHTDFYELTMAYGYWKLGMHDWEAVFHHTFRRAPFGGSHALVAGIPSVLEALSEYRFSENDLEYLRTFFPDDFLDFLRNLRLSVDIDAMPEGTIAYPNQPLLRVQGNLLEAQLLETLLLNLVNFQTLIATKASRVALAAQGDEVVEFGLRRAQGLNGGLCATRATYVGGCHSTSNTLAGKLYGIPVRGTMAHSWVMAFDSEKDSFEAWAEVMPDHCVLLVDTYDTEQGVRHAAAIGRALRERGKQLRAIRLDSGDLLALSLQARKILDEEECPEVAIMASSDLDEVEIARIKAGGSPISIWGVGTRMITSYDQPALGGVYKLGAIRQRGEEWRFCMKTSKSTEPGILQVRRYDDGDLVYAINRPLSDSVEAVDWETRTFKGLGEDLLVPILRGGQPVYTPPPLNETREKSLAGLQSIPERPFVGVERSLYDFKREFVRGVHG